MKEKGYPFPLYSLNLQTTAPDDQAARYSLRIAEGRLCVASPWLRRAAHVAVLPVLRCASHVLWLCEPFAAELAAAGLTPAWRDSMRHWHDALTRSYQERLQLDLDAEDGDARWVDLEQRIDDCWRSLMLWLRLAGLYLPGVPTRLPPRISERAAALDHAGRLLAAGALPPPEDGQLAGLMPRLLPLLTERRALLDERDQRDAQRGRVQDRCLVLRAALMGDLMDCSERARLALSPHLAALFRYERLFPSHKASARPKAPRPTITARAARW